MSKIIDAEDILADARNCIECVWMAAAMLEHAETNSIQAVAAIASDKIEEAIALLDEYRADIGEGPEPADVKPVSPAARTKRKG